ncbi:hypothetical protein, partial [Duganella rivi]|uniref:hypothetical protein n=1 Tax=Duganella rivi TaxID=2666083 RepID=UPI001C2C7830
YRDGSLTQNTDSITTVLFLVEHLMLFVAAPNAHTYRLLIFKDLVLHCEAFCSQQRDEIMKRFVYLVNPYFFSLHSAFACSVSRGTES